MTKWSAVPFDETQVDSTTEIVDLQNSSSNQRIRFSIPTLGQSVVPVHKISDIPLVSGLRQLEQDKVYQFVEEISTSESLVIPFNWNGYIVGMHNSLTKFDYTGTGAAIKMLSKTTNIDAIVTVAGGASVTVVFSVLHGLLNGQLVNITGSSESAYNQQNLIVTNRTSFTFDVQIPFVGDAVGGVVDSTTGYNTINIMNMGFTNADTGTWLDVIGANASSIFRYNNITVKGFASLGGIRNGTIIGYDGNFDFTADPLTLVDIDKATISTTTITNTNALEVSAELLDIFGSLTGDIVLDRMQFNVAVNTQFPIKIDNSVINALISITNSPDNNVATDYFAPTGRDETDPQVFAFNNGTRPNSSTESESRSDVVLVVDGSSGAVPIEDLTPAVNDFVLDSISQEFSIDTSTGLVTYNGLSSKDVLISYSLEAAQVSGGAQDLILDVRINGVQQAKTIRTMTTMGTTDFAFVSSVGGLFTINPGDTFQLFKENTSNTTDTTIQNMILLIR